MDMQHAPERKPERNLSPAKDWLLHPTLAGLARMLLLGLGLMLLYFLARIIAPGAGEEARRALYRLRGGLALLAVAWYGRYILFARLRVPVCWLLLLPGAALCSVSRWPVWLPANALAAAKELLMLAIYLCLLETCAGVMHRASVVELATFPQRAAAVAEIRWSAAKLCFLAALAAGVSLYLAAVDYMFDYLLYSLFGGLFACAVYLAPQAIAAERARGSIAPLLFDLARRTEILLTGPAESRGEGDLALLRQARAALLDSIRLGNNGWSWLYPLGACALLLAAGMLYHW
jgi:hypothetical protein